MDILVEQIEKRARSSKTLLIKIGTVAGILLLIFLCLVLSVVINFYFAVIAMFIVIASFYIIWYVFTSQNVEYEYSIISGTITIAKIIAKRKRKRVIVFETSKIEDMFEYDNRDFDTRLYSHIYDVRGETSGCETYAAVTLTEKHGRSVVLFNPNERFLEAMKPYLQRPLVLRLFYKK